MEYPKRLIICSFDALDALKRAFPSRQIEPSAYARSLWFYWFDRYGTTRMMKLGERIIWVCDHDRGPPYLKPRRILARPLN